MKGDPAPCEAVRQLCRLWELCLLTTVASDSNSSTNSVLEGKTADVYLYSVAQFLSLNWKAPYPMLWAC